MSPKFASTAPSDADKTREQLLAELAEIKSRNVISKKPGDGSTTIRDQPGGCAEEELRRVNRSLKVLSKCKKAMIRADDEAGLLNDICRIIVNVGGYRLAWIGLIENDEAKTVRPVARAGYDEGYVDSLKIALNDPVRGTGPTGISLKAGKPYGSRDVRSGEEMRPWREDALKRGYLSTLNLPLVYEKQVIGALVIYSGNVDAFDDEERGLLFDLAQTLAYGIAAMRDRERRIKAEQELKLVNEGLEELVEKRTVKLRESEAGLAKAQAIARLGSWDVDVGTYTVQGSDELYRIFNFELGTHQHINAYIEKFHPADSARVVDAINAAIYEGKPYNIDYRIIPRSGEVRHVHADGEVTRDRGGQPVRFFGTVQDITERKLAEEEMKGLIHDLGERVKELTVLHKVYDIIQKGRSMREVLQGIIDIVPMALQYPEITAARIAFEGLEFRTLNFLQTTWRQRASFHTNDGKEGFIEVVYLEKRHDEAEGPFLAEEANLLNSLAEIVRIYVDKWYTEEALYRANAQAELYLDLMSHDINNMNQVALGYLEMADDVIRSGGKLGEDNRELVEKPMVSLYSSSRLIDKVMKLRKLKAGELRLGHVDVCSVLARVKDRYSHVAGRDISINYVPPDECLVVANELIDEIFVNIVENSIKHSPPDKPLVIDILLTRVCEGGKEYYRISIEDNGPGIPEEFKDKLFTRFSRGKTKAKGKGLGLYIVKTLVETFRGEIWVEDRVRGDHTKGARFVVVLPAVGPRPR